MKSTAKERTIPTLPNSFPYNELLLERKLMAKTRSWPWKHRGLTLLYTSTSTAKIVAKKYGLDPKALPRGVIVGCGELVDVRPLTDEEKDRLLLQFNNATPEEAEEFGQFAGPDYIAPLDIGFFFTNLKRFKNPIPFKPPKGAVTVFKVPLKLVIKALKEIGVLV